VEPFHPNDLKRLVTGFTPSKVADPVGGGQDAGRDQPEARCMIRPFPLNPDRISAKERLAAVTRILALGLIRFRARQSSQVSELTREISLHFPPDRSGHAKPKRRRVA
jgi:hypothetical protein